MRAALGKQPQTARLRSLWGRHHGLAPQNVDLRLEHFQIVCDLKDEGLRSCWEPKYLGNNGLTIDVAISYHLDFNGNLTRKFSRALAPVAVTPAARHW